MSAGGSVWLKSWSEENSRTGGNPHVGKYIGIYFAFGIGNAALVVMQTLILWIFCSIEVSTVFLAVSTIYLLSSSAAMPSVFAYVHAEPASARRDQLQAPTILGGWRGFDRD